MSSGTSPQRRWRGWGAKERFNRGVPKRPSYPEIQSRKTLFKMLNNEFAHRYGIVPRETGFLVAFSLFYAPLNISREVSLREHPVFLALVSSFTHQEKLKEEKRRPEIRLRFAGYRDVWQEIFACCLCCCCCGCFCFLTLSFSVCLSNGKPGKGWIFSRTTYFPFCVSTHVQGINRYL